MPPPRGRDLELTRKRLIEWFGTKLPEARKLRISELSGPGTTGFSNDTLMFDLCFEEAGRERSEPLVVRIEPISFRVFPEYDVAQQFEVQRILAQTDIPVPRMMWLEEDEGLLGAPFYVMQRLEGRIPTDNPPYHVGGWVTEIRPEERASLWWSGLEILARIHRLDWRELGFGILDAPDAGMTPLERQLAYYARYLAWAAEDAPHATCEAALEWLERNRPREAEPVALCWGDSRIGNMIFRDSRCVAVLDWEMATLGNPVLDLAWWIFMDRHHSSGVGVPRLAGFPGATETVARYEELSGAKVRHLDYYEVFAALRFSVIMIRVGRKMKSMGLLPEDSDFDTNSIPARMLAELLELPPPG